MSYPSTPPSSRLSRQSSLIQAPSPSSRHNPISLRIYKAIGTSFDDPSSRQALEIASSFYSPSSSSTSSSGQAGKNAPEEGDDLLSRRTLVKGQTAAMARKHLKRDVEAKLAGGSQRFLDAFGEVDKVSDLSRSISGSLRGALSMDKYCMGELTNSSSTDRNWMYFENT